MTNVATSVSARGAIVVGHDGSAPASQAVRWAADIAVPLGCRLVVLRTWSLSSAPRPSSWAPGYVPPLTDFEAAVLERLRADVAGSSLRDGVDVSCHVVHGSAGRRLVEASKGARMLVVGSRGAGGFRDLLLGSTADQVVGHAACPVVVVPVTSETETDPLDAELSAG
jgi:nucleotide-binding universal stress UspA family protein